MRSKRDQKSRRVAANVVANEKHVLYYAFLHFTNSVMSPVPKRSHLFGRLENVLYGWWIRLPQLEHVAEERACEVARVLHPSVMGFLHSGMGACSAFSGNLKSRETRG